MNPTPQHPIIDGEPVCFCHGCVEAAINNMDPNAQPPQKPQPKAAIDRLLSSDTATALRCWYHPTYCRCLDCQHHLGS